MTLSNSIRSLTFACLAVGAALSIGAASAAEEQSVRPGVNNEYKNPALDVDRWNKSFQGESREVFLAREEVVAVLGIKPGMTVADVGAGTGIYARLFSQAVGANGKVYAVDIAQPFLDVIKTFAAEENITNIETVLGTDRDTNLPANSVDIIFTSDVYHHFEFPQTMLANIRSVLKDGGQFIIVDYHRIPGVTRPSRLEHVRAGKEVVLEEVKAAGFRLVEEIEIKGFKENYMLRFAKN
jgi:ubiquinone/menaquinone biosynthesis C-methylase UbiE